MTEISLLVIGCLLALLFFIWLAFGKKAASKAATLVIDTVLLALCVAAILCGLLLRQEKYQKEPLPGGASQEAEAGILYEQ
ncbi:MAG: hypothetical protein K2N87_16865 [Eubacterium sp.]|nr:hypothetical protein [Eubacterium sp.]